MTSEPDLPVTEEEKLAALLDQIRQHGLPKLSYKTLHISGVIDRYGNPIPRPRPDWEPVADRPDADRREQAS